MVSESGSRAVSLRIQPRDPLIARDGRPFTAEDRGSRAATLEWPLPQTIAGALRTHIGDSIALDWRGDGPAIARSIEIHGPLLLARADNEAPWRVYLPAPRDALLWDDAGELRCDRLRPWDDLPAGCGTDQPAGLRPLQVTADRKPDASAAFWSLDDQIAWFSDSSAATPPARYLAALPRETRVHVAVDHAKRAAKEGMLYTTVGLAFNDAPSAAGELRPNRPASPATAMLCRVGGAPSGWTPTEGLISMGGERRLSFISHAGDDSWPPLPPAVAQALSGAARLRLQLVTPALFPRGGWRPDWLDAATLEGSPPEAPDLRLRLVAAAIGR